MADTLAFAVVGVGWFGSKRIAALQKLKDAKIAYIIDTDTEKGQLVAKNIGCDYSSEVDKAVSDPRVDCVLVCTPNKMHPEVVTKALSKDKHVLCEKPLARNVEEAKRMIEAARVSKGFLKTGANHRYFPNVKKATELVKSGRIGEPIFFRGYIGHNGEILKGRWFWDKDLAGGGTFLDNGCHLLDISRELLGDFNQCVGIVNTSFWPVSPLEDNGFALYTNDTRKIAMVQSSWIEWYGYMYFEVYGTDGFVIVDSRRANKTLIGRRGEEHTTVYDYSDVPPRSHEEELIDFISHIKKGNQLRPTGEDGLRVLQMVDALYRSSSSGIRVSF
jgi:predicted dehydrogenase